MTTKRLNIKFLAILGVGGVIFLGSVHLIHGWQVRRNAAGLLRRAEAARSEGDLAESARLRLRYLSHVPDNDDEYKQTAYDLKKSLFEKVTSRKELTKRDLDLAIRYMSEAVTRNGTDLDLRREASEFWYLLRKYDFAVDHLEAMGETNNGVTTYDAWTDDDRMRYINSLRLLGGPMEAKAMGEFETTLGWSDAKREFTETGTHPKMLDAYQALVMLLMQKNLDRDSAVKVLDQMVEANNDNPQAFLNRSRLIRYVLGQAGVEQAYRDIDQAYSLAPDDLDVIAAKSSMMLETKRGEEAKRLIELGLDQAESIQEKSRLFRLLSEVYITLKDTEGALAVLDRANREVPRDRDLLWNKARLLLDDKRHKDVESMFKPLLDAGHDEPTIGYLQARILMDQGETLKATRALRKIRDVLPTNIQYEADTYLASGYGKLGKYDLQLATVRGLREKYPDNQQINDNYLAILLQLRRTKDAQEFLRARIAELQDAGTPIPKNYELALMTLQMNDAQIGANTLSEGQQAALDQRFEAALKDESLSDAQRQSLLLRKLRQNDDPKAAKAILQKAINDSPDTYLLWAMLIEFAESEAEATKFFNIMKTKIDAEKYAASMASMRAKIAVKFAPESAPSVLTDLESELGRYTDLEQISLLYEMGTLNLALKNRDEAMRLFEKSLQAPGATAQVKTEILNVLFDDAVTQADPDRIDEIAKRMQATVGDDDEAYRIIEARRIIWNIRNNQISEDERSTELVRARQLIESIRRARKEWLPGILVEADIYRLDNNPVAAIELLEVAHSFQTNNAKIIRAIAQSYRELRQPAKADEWMGKLPSTLRNDSDDRLQLNTLLARSGDWTREEAQKAVQLLETVAPADSEVLNDQLMRSKVFTFLKQMDKAEAAAKRCVAIDPQASSAWTNLVKVYKLQDKQDKAAEVILEAENQLPEATKPIVLGQCYAILGDFNKAEASLVSAWNADKKNTSVKRLLIETLLASKDRKRIEPALQLMQDIFMTGDASNPKEVLDIIWARRRFATILASTKKHQDFLKALDLLEKNAVNGELARADLALMVSFCYARSEKSSWDRGLLRIDQVAQQRKLTDDEIFMKAQLYERYGDQYWDEVKKLTTGVLARNSSNKQAVENYVGWLLKRGEVEEAERWANNNLAEGAVIRLRVALHSDAKRGDFQRAAQKIQQRIPDSKSLNLPAAQSQQLTLADIARELGQYDRRFYKMAEQMLRDLARVVPSEVLRVAAVMGAYGDAGQVEEALKMCFDADKNEVPDAVSAGVALAVLREHPEDWEGPLASAIKDVSNWLDELAAANPEDILLQWRVAEFYDMIGNLDRVEGKYKEILASPKFTNSMDRGMVLNNLAFAMALNGKTAEPMKLIAEAETLLGDRADLIDTKGYIYLVQGETDKAIDEFEKAIASGPKSGQKFFHLALAFHKKNDRSKAENSWKEALGNGLDRSKLPPALRTEFDKLQREFGGLAERSDGRDNR